MLIRKEEIKDYDMIYSLVKEAFAHAKHADGNEQDLVNDLYAINTVIKVRILK